MIPTISEWFKPKSKNEYNRIWRAKNRAKHLALKHKQNLKDRASPMANAWKNDYKLRGKSCYICGSAERLEFHHTNYEKHEGLTLCFKCHRQLHKNIRDYINNVKGGYNNGS